MNPPSPSPTPSTIEAALAPASSPRPPARLPRAIGWVQLPTFGALAGVELTAGHLAPGLFCLIVTGVTALALRSDRRRSTGAGPVR